MVIDAGSGSLTHTRVGELATWLRAGDLVVVNDAATLPASLHGTTATGEAIELRLAGTTDEVHWDAVIFGGGDWRTRTEHRAPPPRVVPGDELVFGGTLRATVESLSALSTRLVTLRFNKDGSAFWRDLYALGRPVQYAHVRDDLPLWHVQTRYASKPWAMELPSAGRPLRWSLLEALRARSVALATITHAAGLSATGDDSLDAMLPLPERYDIPVETVRAVEATRARGGRVVAIGTSVVRALEGAARANGGTLKAGAGVTDLKLNDASARSVVSAVFSGMHEPGTSHFALLSAFAPPSLLLDAVSEGTREGYLGHEFGDACLVLAA